ncbi:hypothetical protein KIW84_051408 [Lathyrus oleraceus]|uniref:Uncharacterized protein n=1 Tax=Pisum sativum TaxID=3888 RepID=A0A9D5ADM8_PEA|nr:hypothetical protein KIW84_051408 [Pisum sativum]
MKNSSYRPHFVAPGSFSTRPASSSAAPASSSIAPTSIGAPAIATQMATNVGISDSRLWPDFVTKAFIDIIAHDKASQSQKKGCDNYKLLEIIFNKNNATRVLHHSSTQDPPNTNEENELGNQYLNNGSASHVCVDNDSPDDNLHEVEHITRSGKR